MLGESKFGKPLDSSKKKGKLRKHSNFYKVIDALVNTIEEIHKGCIVFDMHSYNYVRHDKDLPVFNIGTENIDNKRYQDVTNRWFKELQNIKIRNQERTTKSMVHFREMATF